MMLKLTKLKIAIICITSVVVMVILGLLISQGRTINKNIVNVCIFGNYLPEDLIAKFTKETGIKVNITECSSNEALLAKLQTGGQKSYDLVAPSSYYISKMVKLGMLQALDFTKVPNYRHVLYFLKDPKLNSAYQYNVPYCWGTTGISVNTSYFKESEVLAWRDLWEPKFLNKLVLLDDMRESFGLALIKLGFSVNDEDPSHIKLAYQELKKLIPNIRAFNAEGIATLYLDEDAVIGNAWSGDMVIPQRLNPNLAYIYPKEGFVMWFDGFAVLKNAPNQTNAYKLINFLMRPDISLKISQRLGFASANQIAYKQFTKANKHLSAAYLDPKKLAKCQVQQEISEKARRQYESYWEKLRLGK